MAYRSIGTGTTPNDNTGDSLLIGAVKINSNFEEIYSALGDGNKITFDQNRKVNTGDGLSGGGNLTADRTLTVDNTVLRTSGGQTINGSLTATSFVGNGTIPVGGIIMWSGSIATIPTNWSLCNGSNGTPNLQDRFIVCAGNGYNVGATGGAATVTLTTNQIPAHSHSGSTSGAGSHSHSGTTAGAGGHTHGIEDPGHNHTYTAALKVGESQDGNNDNEVGNNQTLTTNSSKTGISINGVGDHAHNFSTSSANNHTHPVTIGNTGGGQAHENRPPYYALAFIMRIA